jgi:outer membrane beta-barrel protein
VEIGAFLGAVSTNSFINDMAWGGSLGYHFSEYFAFNALYWKDSVSNSSAYNTFVNANGVVPNTDEPRSFYGGEIAFSPLYGKLSVMNQRIIYFDTHLLLGGGIRQAESGNHAAALFGIGQQIYLSQFFSLRIDYRLLRFKEILLEKSKAATLGQPVGEGTRLDSTVTLGINILL